jgi:hypothetical protein
MKMKTKKIMDICKRNKKFRLYYDEDNDMQWISDSFAIYPLLDVPILSGNNICKLYDITDKQRDSISFIFENKLPSNLNLNDVDVTDTRVERLDISLIVDGGGLLIPVMTEEGLLFLRSEYLAPFADMKESEVDIYTRKTASGDTIFAIKIGLLLYALVSPYRVIDEKFVKQLENLYELSNLTLINKNQEIENNAEENSTRG